jgi:3-dehydroquinate dehydratase
MKLSSLKRPFICAVVAEPDARSSIKLVDSLENSPHVDSFEINIAQLPVSSLRDVFASTNKPCIATCRRASFMKLYGYNSLPTLSSDERAWKLLRALSDGASTIDFELDIFDEQKSILDYGRIMNTNAQKPTASSTEISKKSSVIRRQMELATQIKEIGGETMISCHSLTTIKQELVFDIANSIESRGADFGKIVMVTSRGSDLITLLELATKIRRKFAIPFNLMNMGYQAILGRLLSVAFGSSWIYCRTNSRHSFKGQPSLSEVLNFFERYLEPRIR